MKFLVALFAVVAVASAATVEAEVPILRQTAEIDPSGSYSHSYETGNGIFAEEQGTLKGEAIEAVGSFRYVSPEGEKVEFTYTAGEDGYVASGSHLPVAPELPPLIARALEYIRAHPYKEPETGKKF